MPDLFTALTSGHTTTSHEGGAVYRVDDRVALRRFLIVGAFGTFYTAPGESVTQWKDRVDAIVTKDPKMALGMVLDVAIQKLAHRRDPSLFVLARLMLPDMPRDVRRAAGDALSIVAVTGTDLLHFVDFRYGSTRTSNRTFRRSVLKWFERRDVGDLMLQAVKYDQRDGWSMRDVLRLVRPGENPATPVRNAVYRWMAHPEARLTLPHVSIPEGTVEEGREHAAHLMVGYSQLRQAFVGGGEAAKIIREHRIPREAVPPDLLKDPQVWLALKGGMPAQAFLRNLGKLGGLGLLGGEDRERILRAGDKLHPFHILLARVVYETGRSVRGSQMWPVNREIVGALDDAFHRAFGTLKVDYDERPLIALDVSGSMSHTGEVVQPVVAEAALAMILAKQYPNASFVTFSGGNGFQRDWWGMRRTGALSPITIHGMTLTQVLQNISAANALWGPTEINLPFEHALEADYSAAIVMTDNETRNRESAAEIIRRVQQKRPEFRAAVVALAANEISVLDPNDVRQADFVGMDASLPRLLTMFLEGDLD